MPILLNWKTSYVFAADFGAVSYSDADWENGLSTSSGVHVREEEPRSGRDGCGLRRVGDEPKRRHGEQTAAFWPAGAKSLELAVRDMTCPLFVKKDRAISTGGGCRQRPRLPRCSVGDDAQATSPWDWLFQGGYDATLAFWRRISVFDCCLWREIGTKWVLSFPAGKYWQRCGPRTTGSEALEQCVEESWEQHWRQSGKASEETSSCRLENRTSSTDAGFCGERQDFRIFWSALSVWNWIKGGKDAPETRTEWSGMCWKALGIRGQSFRTKHEKGNAIKGRETHALCASNSVCNRRDWSCAAHCWLFCTVHSKSRLFVRQRRQWWSGSSTCRQSRAEARTRLLADRPSHMWESRTEHTEVVCGKPGGFCCLQCGLLLSFAARRFLVGRCRRFKRCNTKLLAVLACPQRLCSIHKHSMLQFAPSIDMMCCRLRIRGDCWGFSQLPHESRSTRPSVLLGKKCKNARLTGASSHGVAEQGAER